MAVLTAAVVVLAAIVMLNLSVTVALLKRLRSEAVEVASRRPDGPGGLPVGSPGPEFAAEAVDGTMAEPGVWAGRRTLIGFFATNCPGCSKVVPGFSAEAASLEERGISVLSVLETTPGADPAPLKDLLSRAGTLVVEQKPGSVKAAFGAKVTPSFFLLGADGRIEGKGLTLEEALPAVAAARG